MLFNGVKAVPLTVAYAKLSVQVPPGATTGRIVVVTPSGEGRSKTAFTVT